VWLFPGSVAACFDDPARAGHPHHTPARQLPRRVSPLQYHLVHGAEAWHPREGHSRTPHIVGHVAIFGPYFFQVVDTYFSHNIYVRWHYISWAGQHTVPTIYNIFTVIILSILGHDYRINMSINRQNW